MKRAWIALAIALLATPAAADEWNLGGFYPYARVGIGYKFQEPEGLYYYDDGKIKSVYLADDSAIFEAGFENGDISLGLKHDSQWSTGWPFNGKNAEYGKTEVFIAYKIGGKP